MGEKSNVETIRTLTAEMFEKKCAVSNPERMIMSDEEKKLYFQCLCFVLSGEASEITDEQHQYLLRLLKGAEMPDSLEAYFETTGNLAEDSLQILYPVFDTWVIRKSRNSL